MAKKSNKQLEYTQTKQLFHEHKSSLTEHLEKLVESYKKVYEFEVKTFELHQQTIENILSENFVINYDHEQLLCDFDISTGLEKANQIINDLEGSIVDFKDNSYISIEESEEPIVEAFEELITRKKTIILEKKQVNQKQINFINSVNSLIQETNSRLDSDATQKITSQHTLGTLKQNIKEHFKNVVHLKKMASEIENFDYSKQEEIPISSDVSMILEVESDISLKNILLDCFIGSSPDESLYLHMLRILSRGITIKNYPHENTSEVLYRKLNNQLGDIYLKLDTPEDYLQYSEGSTSKSNSPGFNSEKYLEIILKNPTNKMIFIDQPEDNLGNKFISDTLVSIFREIKFKKQIFLVTHNPSIVVYGDAECIILAENNGKITYKQIMLEDKDSQKEICSVLDGGEYIFDNRSKKYNIQRILRGDS